MKCPRTGSKLKHVKVGGIEVDISEACGGVFFDNQEIEKFKAPSDIRGDALTKHLRKFANQPLDLNKRINCPKCENVVMMRRYESPLKIVEIDECPGCAGIWLDTGELDKLRDNHLSGSERALLRERLIKGVEHGSYSASSKSHYANDETVERISKVMEITSFLFRW